MKPSMRTLSAAILASSFALLVTSSAEAQNTSCQARVAFSVAGANGAATEYNNPDPGLACASVQVKMVTYVGGGIYVTSFGPVSSTSSSTFNVGVSFTFYGRAKVNSASAWSAYKQWTSSGVYKTFP